MVFDTVKWDMLAVKKVKLHGMSEPRWTVKEKIIQYKGLINLYRRDKKIVCVDKSVALKRDINIVMLLKKRIASARSELDNLLLGDHESIMYTLQENKGLLLACKDLHPNTIMEHVSQVNFNYRKQLDLCIYRKQVKTNKLIKLKLLVAELEDKLAYSVPGQLPIEIECKILTARVQDADLKKEATIVINESYKKIIKVCKKDSIYFDAILESLRADRIMQGKCMLNAIILGQLATEYLYDRTKEFVELEKMVKKDMRERKVLMDELVLEVNNCAKQLKFLIRKDSDMHLGLQNTFTNADIRQDLNCVCKQLDVLKSSFDANSYSTLSDWLYEQSYEEGRLAGLKNRFIKGRDTLRHKINHANLMHEYMYNTMIETTFEYKRQKQSVIDGISDKIKKINECNRLRNKKANMIVKIKSSLQHLEQVCKCVKAPYELKEVKGRRQRSMSEIEEEALNIKANCLELVEILVPKLILLSLHDCHFENDLQQDFALMNYETLVSNRTRMTHFDESISDECLVGDDIKVESALVPTRAEIKANSKLIVRMNTKNEDLIPVFYCKPRRKWKVK